MNILGQLGLILAFGLCGEVVAHYLPFPFPSAVIGLLLLLAAVKGGLLSEKRLQPSADFLSRNMAFFFLPSAVGIMQSYPQIRAVVVPLLAICVVSTVATFAAAYGVTRLIQILQEKRR